MKLLTFIALLLVGCTPVPQEQSQEETTAVPDAYGAQVIQIGGEGSHTVTKSAWALDEHANFDAEQFVSVSFNTPGDTMWVYCAENYQISNCESSTSDLVPDEYALPGACGLVITDQLKNIITFACNLN